MAKATGMSQSAVTRIWRAFGLKPHLVDGFKLSPDPQFIDKVRDIVGLYLNPPNAAVVLAVVSASAIDKGLDRSQPAHGDLLGIRRALLESSGAVVGDVAGGFGKVMLDHPTLDECGDIQ